MIESKYTACDREIFLAASGEGTDSWNLLEAVSTADPKPTALKEFFSKSLQQLLK